MGLDSFWTKDGVDYSQDGAGPDFDPPLELTGGMFSGNGAGSFRGKVYHELIKCLTGEGLYRDVIRNYRVTVIADRLDEYDYDEAMQEYDYWSATTHKFDVSEQEFQDLKRMFRAYADEGYQLEGWW